MTPPAASWLLMPAPRNGPHVTRSITLYRFLGYFLLVIAAFSPSACWSRSCGREQPERRPE